MDDGLGEGLLDGKSVGKIVGLSVGESDEKLQVSALGWSISL